MPGSDRSGLVTTPLGDPPVREDGRCAGCGKPCKPERSRRYAPGVAALDPFCSTECCKRFHDVVNAMGGDAKAEPDDRLAA